MTDPEENVTTFVYSATGNVTYQFEFYDGREFTADASSYNADGRLTSQSDALGYPTTYTYDHVGNQLTVTDQNGNTTTTVYDSMNRVIETIAPLGVTVSYTYDKSGNQQTVTDALGHTTTTLYDALDRATTIISAVERDHDDHLRCGRSRDQPDRSRWQHDPWAYDADDRMTTLTEPNGSTVTYVYDKDSELTDTTDEDGRRTTYSYNADGDQTGETWLNSSGHSIYIATYTYDADRRDDRRRRPLRDADLHLRQRRRSWKPTPPPARGRASRPSP